MTTQIPFDPDFDQITKPAKVQIDERIEIIEPRREASPSEAISQGGIMNARTMFMFGAGTALVLGSFLGNFILIKLLIK